MSAIDVKGLFKTYKKEERDEGFMESLRALFRKRYREIKALVNVSFEIEEGEMVGIIGPNGAGKTTLLKILSGVLYPDRGKVSVMGYVPQERKREFLNSMTFFTGQRGFLSLAVWDLPAVDGYELIRCIYRIPRGEFRKRLEFFTELLDIADLIRTPMRSLSLGERTKVELVGALLHYPKVVFLDEPTIGLDLLSQKRLWEFFRVYNQERRATLIITSHYTRDIEELGRRIIILHQGRILYDGDRRELMEKALSKKLLRVTFEGELRNFLGEEWKWDGNVALKEVERSRVKDEITKVSGLPGVVDISVEELPFEDVIREIYRRGDLYEEVPGSFSQ